jgi:DNA-binding NarL/FixJ family response regulator
MAPTTAVVAAPDRRTRAAMRAALAAGRVQVTGEACTRWDAGECVRATLPDAAVIDVELLSIRDFFLRGWGPVSRDTRIVAVGPDDEHLRRHMCDQGAAAYVTRDRLADELAGAVSAVCSSVMG